MLRLICAAMLSGLLLAGGAARSEPAAAPEVALKRVNLLVRDLDRSLAVYRDILGFRVFAISESGPQSYSYPVFRLPPQAKLRFCTLDSSTEVRAKLEAAGLAVVEPRSSKTAEGQTFREMAFTDPDGHLVVLYQLD